MACRSAIAIVVNVFLLCCGFSVSVEAADAARCFPTFGQLVSLQGQVELQQGDAGARQPASLFETICVGDVIHVGALSRATVQLFDAETILRLDQNTTSKFVKRPDEAPSVLDLLKGAVQFLSRVPQALEVRTPYVNAGIEGTEFLVAVDTVRGQTRIVVYEGIVVAENTQGKLRLTQSQAAIAGLNEAPVVETVVRSRDAVHWTLHYQPVLAALAAPSASTSASDDRLNRIKSALAASGPAAAIAAIDALPAAARDEQSQVWRAALLMQVGRWQAAQETLDSLVQSGTASGEVHALQAVIYVTQNKRDRALVAAEKAVGLSPDASASLIALSYAQQAKFDLEAARASLRKATELAPNDALAWARLSELRLSFGERGAAQEAAETSVALAPDMARAHTVLGFAALTRIDLETAKPAFEKAIALRSDDPLPHLGYGLTKIRNGDLVAGRREIEVAMALASNSSLMRSYLGKAYFEEKRDPLDATQLQIAKDLDPNDPTPYFYDAIRKQTENRPIEALRDIEQAIALNDNRAVYRSRLLLDEDRASRGARLGMIYRDLGFEQLALAEGWRSVTLDPTNHSAHRLLADTYSALPRHEIARDSELLQSQLLQPLNVDPVQPRLLGDGSTLLDDIGLSGLGFNEFSQLYAGNQLRLDADGVFGSNRSRGDNVIISGIYDRFSFSLGQFHFDTEGVRQNNELNQNIYNAFGQYNFTDRTSVQVELRAIDNEFGDRALRFDPANFFTSSHQDVESSSIRLGLRHDFAPNSTTIGSYVRRELDDDLNTGAVLGVNVKDDADFVELRHLYKGSWFNLTGGAGYLHSDQEIKTSVTFFPMFPPFVTDTFDNVTHRNAYIYSSINYWQPATIDLGVSFDKFRSDVIDRDQWNPKVGAIVTPFPGTTVRAAAFRTLKRTLTSSQTIEPTQVAGFNQFFDDINGTSAWRYGAAIEQKFDLLPDRKGPELFAGIELSKRDLDVPTQFLTPAPTTVDVDWEENTARAYVNWIPFDWLALSAEYRFERLVRDNLAQNDDSLAESKTHRVPIEARVFHPSGWYFLARGTYVSQEGQFADATNTVVSGSDSFWVFDASIGYRFPKRRGFVSLDVRNLFDEGFNFQDSDPSNPGIVPDQLIMGRLTLHF